MLAAFVFAEPVQDVIEFRKKRCLIPAPRRACLLHQGAHRRENGAVFLDQDLELVVVT